MLPNSVIPIENLPPLRKPTPASKPKSVVRARSVVQPQPVATTSNTVFSNKVSNVEAVSDCECPREMQMCNPYLAQKSNKGPLRSEIDSVADYCIPHKVPDVPDVSQFRPSSPPTIKQNCRVLEDESNKRVRFEVSATPPPDEVPPSSSVGTCAHKQNIGMALAQTSLGPPIGEVEEERTRRLQKERFCALENLIVDKIHDDDFCKLVCDVGKVWQRMGFEQVFENGQLFHIGDEDLE